METDASIVLFSPTASVNGSDPEYATAPSGSVRVISSVPDDILTLPVLLIANGIAFAPAARAAGRFGFTATKLRGTSKLVEVPPIFLPAVSNASADIV